MILENWKPQKWLKILIGALIFAIILTWFAQKYGEIKAENSQNLIIAQTAAYLIIYGFFVILTLKKSFSSVKDFLMLVLFDGAMLSLIFTIIIIFLGVNQLRSIFNAIVFAWLIFLLLHTFLCALASLNAPTNIVKKAFLVINICLGIMAAIANFLFLILKNYDYGIAENNLSKFTEIGFTPNEIVQILANAVFLQLFMRIYVKIKSRSSEI